jgi:hypothetical protein
MPMALVKFGVFDTHHPQIKLLVQLQSSPFAFETTRQQHTRLHPAPFSISHARTWGVSCAFAYQGLSCLPQGENAMLLLDQVKVRRCEARCHIGVTPPRYVNAEARRL